MVTTSSASRAQDPTLDDIEKRIEALTAELWALKGEVATQSGGPTESISDRTSRREMLRRAAVAAVGVAGAATVLGREPVRAANGDTVVVAGTLSGSARTSINASNGAVVDPGFFFNGAGIRGIGATGAEGLDGYAPGSVGFGVWGASDTGYGVVGSTDSGVDLYAGGTGRVWLLSYIVSGPPVSGSHSDGEIVRDSGGQFWVCVSSGTPGTWRRLAAVYQGAAGGAVNFLTAPLRLLDTRPGQVAITAPGVPIGPVATFNLTVAGGSTTVPSGATGILGNFTVATPGGPGNLVVYPAGAPRPTAATIVFGTNMVGGYLANFSMTRIGTTNQISIYNESLAATHVIFDAVGYTY